MKTRPSVISRLWRKCFGERREESSSLSPLRLNRADATARRSATAEPRPARHGIEMLEGRIAPASLVNPSTITFNDADGDHVTVKFSKPLFAQTGTPAELTALLNNVFHFSTGSGFGDGVDPAAQQQLQSIDLTKLPLVGTGANAKSLAAGVSFTVTADQTQGPTGLQGDGFANVGAIFATSSSAAFGLGKVTIDGDLGQIDAGVSSSAVGLAALKVHSLGAVANTQPTGSGFPNIESKITGSLGSLIVLDDMKEAYVHVVSGSFGSAAVGKIGSINIGGSITTNPTAPNTTSTSPGVIQTDAGIGSVKIGSGLAGDGIIGGGALNSGSIIAAGKIGSVKINGDLLGGDGSGSGSISSLAGIGAVTITGKIGIADTAAAGGGGLAATIRTDGDLASLTVGGSLFGGAAEKSGWIVSGGKMGLVKIGGDLVGGGPNAGGIEATGKITGVEIGGSLKGGEGIFSGFIYGHSDIGTVKIHGDLQAGEGAIERTGEIIARGSIAKVQIDGSLIGGDGIGTGSIHAALSGHGTLGSVTVGEQLLGGHGDNSASIVSDDKIGSVVVKGTGVANALQGDLGKFSASIYSAGTLGSVKLTGKVVGGDGNNSASIQATGLLGSFSASGDLVGGKGLNSASILSHDNVDAGIAGDLGKVTIGGKLLAGEGNQSAAIRADGNLVSVALGGLEVGAALTAPGVDSAAIETGLGFFHAGDVKSIAVSGAIDGHTADHTLLEIHGSLGSLTAIGGIANGEIHVAGKLGSVVTGKAGRAPVLGDVTNVTITAGAELPTSAKLATAIASITVNGSVTNSQILAGYDVNGQATNGDAQIGTVKVTKNWSASDLVAGVKAVNGEFGDSDDAAIDTGSSSIVSRIANVLIGGTVTGTSDSTTDHFGFVAEQIGTFKVAGVTITDEASHDLVTDVTVREVATV